MAYLNCIKLVLLEKKIDKWFVNELDISACTVCK